MIDTILSWAGRIDTILWGPWTMAFIALVGLYLGLRSRFFQLRGVRLIWRNTLGKVFSSPREQSREKITPFQATATALASTVGMGNMAGVATALSVGGPGAIFWMWIFALLGMMTKTVEITLAVHYREFDPDGALHGGPMYYMRKGLGWPLLAKLFSLGILVNSLFTATLIQSHTVGRSFLKSYALNPYLTTGIMAVVTGVVIFGGIRRIGRFCETLVPLMSLLYIAGGLVIFVLNFDRIPDVFSSIFTYAFAPAPAAGGFAGAAIAATLKQGMARGMLSNEAGLGTAPMVHANADTPHPFQQGLWGAFEVFFDTIVICTITSFAILSTGVLSGALARPLRHSDLGLDPHLLPHHPDRILHLFRDGGHQPDRPPGRPLFQVVLPGAGRRLRGCRGRGPALGPGQHLGRRLFAPQPGGRAGPEWGLLQAHAGLRFGPEPVPDLSDRHRPGICPDPR